MLRIFILWLLSCSVLIADPLPAEQAFSISANIAKNVLTVNFNVAPGYHLYRQRINFSSPTLTLEKPSIPEGRAWHDATSGATKILDGNFKVRVAFKAADDQETHIYVGYQGCNDSGFCYPPVMKDLLVQLSPLGQQIVEITNADLPATSSANTAAQIPVNNLLPQHNLPLALIILFGIGLLLAFTPCVLPMVPILSGIILGQKNLTWTKALLLSTVFVLAMAVTYAFAGIALSLAGSNFQATLQQPWMIAIFSLLFLLLAGSMFGLFELRLPHILSQHLTRISHRQQGGHFIGVFIMGVISALVVSPCVSAPLVAVLAYIAQQGKIVFGGLALFTMALGMGLPLIIAGTLGGKFLPRSGAWMLRVKHIGGFLLLLVAAYLLSRIIPASLNLILYGFLALIFAGYLWFINGYTKIISLLFLSYGLVAMGAGILGHDNPLKPWQGTQKSGLHFIAVNSVADVQQQLAEAQGQIVILDFYADWCVACHILQRNVFADPQVQQQLQSFILLRADVTENNADDQALEKYFGVYGPPTIIFFDKQGNELKQQRIVGEVSKENFLANIATL